MSTPGVSLQCSSGGGRFGVDFGTSRQSGDLADFVLNLRRVLRRLFFIEKSGNISAFNLVLDHKATNKTLKLWAFITQTMKRTYLADNHSKILLVQAESGEQISVVTSQNLTRGNRHESTFISTSPDIFNTLHVSVMDLIKNHSVPLTDLFQQRINAAGANN